MADIGLKVSIEDTDALTATGTDVLLNNYPQAKLDTKNPKSFQNITMTFLNNPPEPPGLSGIVDTLVYSFPHGYTYIPECWFLVQVVTPPAVAAYYQEYFQDSGLLSSRTPFDQARFYVLVDATTVYMYVEKYVETAFGGLPNDITGSQIRIRPYVFVDDIGV